MSAKSEVGAGTGKTGYNCFLLLVAAVLTGSAILPLFASLLANWMGCKKLPFPSGVLSPGNLE